MADKEDTLKYGVSDLADACGITPAYTRVWLRQRKVAKAGRSYGWKTKAEIDALVKEYKASGADEKAKEKDKASAAKATAKATPKAKPASKAA